jgi:hypothetical protein
MSITKRLTPGSEPNARIDGRPVRLRRTLLYVCCRIQPIQVPHHGGGCRRSAGNLLLPRPARVLERLGERARRRPLSMEGRPGPSSAHRGLSPRTGGRRCGSACHLRFDDHASSRRAGGRQEPRNYRRLGSRRVVIRPKPSKLSARPREAPTTASSNRRTRPPLLALGPGIEGRR